MATAGVPLWSTTAASNGTADPAVNFAEGMAPSAVNDSGRALMASVAKWRDDLYGITTGGTSTAFTIATGSTFATAAAMSGVIFTIIPHATSGAAATLAVDSLTARALNISTGVAMPTGAMILGTPYLVKYVHATTEFICLGSLAVLPSLDITGALGVTGNFSVNTNKFTVTAASGNTAILGDLALNTNKFTVAAATGNSLVAGTLDVTSDFKVATNKFTVAAASGDTVVAGTLVVTGVATLIGGASFAGAILTSSATAGIGYTTGAGGTVTQATNKTTGATLNKICGQITLAAGTIGNQASATFTLTNSTIAAGDIMVFNHVSGGTIGAYLFNAACAAGSASIQVINWTGGALNEQPVMRFAVIKAVTA